MPQVSHINYLASVAKSRVGRGSQMLRDVLLSFSHRYCEMIAAIQPAAAATGVYSNVHDRGNQMLHECLIAFSLVIVRKSVVTHPMGA